MPGSITYAEVEALRVAIPLGVIPYNQGTISPVTDRRADCSGLISYVWDLPKSGPGTWLNAYTTQSLWEQGLIEEIPRTELRAGDAIGFCGPDTANGGGGHIALYRANKGDLFHVWDHGSGMGPKDRFVTWNNSSTGWLAPGKCKAWRYVHIEEEDMGSYNIEEQTYSIIQMKDTYEAQAVPPTPDPGLPKPETFPNPLTAFLKELAAKVDEIKATVDKLSTTGGIGEDRAREIAREEISGTELQPKE